MKINIIFNKDTEKYQYDTEALVKFFFPTNENEEADLENIYIDILEENEEKFVIKGEFKGITHTFDEAPMDIKEKKNIIKRLVYMIFSEYKGKGLPWGILTGIRPAKIVLNMIEDNIDITDEEILYIFKNNYYVSEEKTRLAIDIARKELDILKEIDYKDGYSLYIGVPFCPSTCLYCSFTSYPIGQYEKKAEDYVDALIKEMEFTSGIFKSKKLNTVYMGGGTPTTLSPSQLDRVISKLKKLFDLKNCREITVEAGRPDSITEEKLKVLRKYGISRISINPQTMKQETLDIIGRKHTVEQVKESFFMARRLGFDNINMDFIVGLPDENIDDVKNSMEEMSILNPDSITIHSLAIKRAARLAMFKDKYKEMTMENNEEIMSLCLKYAEKLNMKPYYLYRQKNMAGNMENVGYAVEGKECAYNILIMEEKQTILALGAGGVTKYVFPYGGRIERVDNVKNVDIYIEKIDDMIKRKEKFFIDIDNEEVVK